jgi:ion channel
VTGWAAAGSVSAGCLVLLVTLLDLLTTAFHPTAQSTLTARFNRTVWFVFKQSSRLLPARGRHFVLSWTMPVVVAGLVVFWLLALLFGFGLIYLPYITTSESFSSTVGRLNWGDAFYFSGLCLTSIGFGEILPRDDLLRAAVIAEGMAGLLVVGVAITYALAVFPVLPVLRVLASTLNEETDGQANAVPMVHRYLAADSAEALTARCRELATELRLLSEAHDTHPVLFYVHPKRAEQSFLRVLIVTQQLVLLLRYGVRRSDFATLVRDPRVVGLEASLIAVLRQLGRSLHLQVQPVAEVEEQRRLAHEYDDLVKVLQEAHLRGDEQPTRVERQAYIRFQLVTKPYIHAYWANTGYTREELWGDHPPLLGTTAPIFDPDVEDEAE